MELTNLQKIILEAPEDKIAVEASAAALKTATMTEKVRQLMRAGVDPTTIAVITFTRMAAEELSTRLEDDYKDGLFIGTIHALAYAVLQQHGIQEKATNAIEEENFEMLFELCLEYNVKPQYDWILIDEAQDTGELPLKFIFELIQPKHYFVAFDLKQTIYQFNNSNPDLLVYYLDQTGATWYSLNQNFRNGYNILQYAKKIIQKIGYKDNSIAASPNQGHVLELVYNDKYIIGEINKYGEYKDWAILTRTNVQLEEVSKDLKRAGIPYNTFKQGDLNKQQLNKRLNENKVKLITIHSSKGLGFPNVVVYGAKWWNNDEYYLNYVAATRAMDRLYWCQEPRKLNKYKGHRGYAQPIDGFY